MIVRGRQPDPGGTELRQEPAGRRAVGAFAAAVAGMQPVHRSYPV